MYTILGTSRGCKALAFEPLSQNILRLSHSLRSMGLEGRAMLFKHAVGKAFGPVKIGFRPFNPGASALNVDGEITEHILQITIDGLLLGGRPPVFPADVPEAGAAASGVDAEEGGGGAAPAAEAPPPVIGRNINFIKIDTCVCARVQACPVRCSCSPRPHPCPRPRPCSRPHSPTPRSPHAPLPTVAFPAARATTWPSCRAC